MNTLVRMWVKNIKKCSLKIKKYENDIEKKMD